VHIEPELVSRYPDRILPKNTVAAAAMRERTLTNLYSQRPQWLIGAHRDLDDAVAAAYGWPTDISEEDALAKLLELNLSRAPVERTSVTEEKQTAPSLKKGRKRIKEQTEMLLPISGKKSKETPAAKTTVRPHARRRRA
jgi:hypothetical protein